MDRRILGLGCGLILLTQLLVQVKLAQLDSQTTDEAVHLSAGYTYLTKGDYRYNPEHPPLVKTLAALPLIALHPHEPNDSRELWSKSESFFYDSWQENRRYGEELLYGAGNDPTTLLFWARMPMVFLTLLLGLSILLIAWRHWGAWAGAVAISLYAFDPIVTAHGHLVTTDIGAALGYLLTIYTAWQLSEKVSWGWAIGFGAALGMALLMKHTMIIALPVLALLLLGKLLLGRNWQLIRRLLPKIGVSLLISWVVIWAGFGFRDRVIPPSTSITSEVTQIYPGTPTSPLLDRLYQIGRPALALLPGDYLKGLFLVINHTDNGHDAYLLGQYSSAGWWYYFPILFALKTPLPTLILLAIGLYYLAKKRPRDGLALSAALAAGIFLIVACFSRANLGIRHILPIYPLLFIVVGWAAANNQKIRPVLVVGILWIAITFGLTFPGYLGYFNRLAGAPANNYHITTDSNLDWGQDLWRINSYIQENRLVKPYVEYGWDGLLSLDYYLGGNYRLLGIEKPAPGEIVILGASAYLQLQDTQLAHCQIKALISNGTFVCQMEN